MNYRTISEAYDRFFADGTTDAERVGWKDTSYQDSLFRILLDGLRQRESRKAVFSVLDAGCGLGNFSDALRDEFPKAHYTGMDVRMPSIMLARQKHPKREFLHGDVRSATFDRKWDYVVACGLFNIFYELDEPQHIGNVQASLRAMWRTARRGMVWNHITGFGNDFKNAGVYYASPAVVQQWSMDHLSPYLTVRHDYYRWAFSVYVYRDAPGLVTPGPAVPE